MKPTGFVEISSAEALPKLKAKRDYVRIQREHQFANKMNRLMDTWPVFNWFKPVTMHQAFSRLVNAGWLYLLEDDNEQIEQINGLILACQLGETVLINTDELQYVLL